MKRLRAVAVASAVVVAGVAAAAAIGVGASAHAVEPADLGSAASTRVMSALVDTPGPITVDTFVAADWEVDRGGLIDLGDPRAKAAKLTSGLEPIQIYVHVLTHPQRGRFLVDSGVDRFVADPERGAIHGLMGKFIHLDRLHVRRATAAIVAADGGPLAGVFLTHLHFDHITGLPDVPRGTPIYAGPGETTERDALNFFVRGPTDRLLAGHAPLREWRFAPDPDGRFAGVVDVFGDGSLFAIWVPGHTAGSTAYVARTPKGGVLFTGDTSHTAWGWTNGVPPGTFTRDRKANARSLDALRAFAEAHPTLAVRLGHQRIANATD